MDRPSHPLQEALVRRRLSYKKAATLCLKSGWTSSLSENYLKNICRGWNEPSYDLAKFLADQFKLSVSEIKDYPYTRTRKRRAA